MTLGIVEPSLSRCSSPWAALFVYRNGFEYLRVGYAAAATVVMLVLTGLLIVTQYAVLRRWRYGRIA